MKSVEKEIEKYGWNVEISNDNEKGVSILSVEHDGDFDFIYEVRFRRYDMPTYAFPTAINPNKGQKKYARAEVYLQDGNKAYNIYGYEMDVIANDIIDQFEKHRHFLHNTSGLNPVIPID
ncbi:MAG: hypothetical protein KA157_06910 [Aliarcobacter sp.]|nr:hypothetical protein [Aliarcobacter sp.]